jgi:hypothetical protein
METAGTIGVVEVAAALVMILAVAAAIAQTVV